MTKADVDGSGAITMSYDGHRMAKSRSSSSANKSSRD